MTRATRLQMTGAARQTAHLQQQRRFAPMVMEPSLTMAKLSGKLDELKEVIDVTCGSELTGLNGLSRIPRQELRFHDKHVI